MSRLPTVAQTRDRQTPRRGLSLAELVVSIGVVSIGLLALMAVLAASQKAAAHGETLSEATGHARLILEVIRSDNLRSFPGGNSVDLPTEATGLNDISVVPSAANFNSMPLLDAPIGEGTNLTQFPAVRTPGAPPQWPSQRYRRTILAERLTSDSSDYRFGLRKFTVNVFWLNEGVLKSTSVSGLTRLREDTNEE